MAVYKRGRVWWYSFVFNGERIQESTKQKNKRVAEQIEAAHRTALAKGEVGIRERKPVPRLRDFAPRFMAAVEARNGNKPRTVAFYKEKLSRLLEHEPLASAKLDEIDEPLIEAFVQVRRKSVAPATVNRQLATLRRLLRLAYEWKIVQRVPRIRMLPGERCRDFVLSPDHEVNYLAIAPQPLQDVAVLILDGGLRVGEALALEWCDIHLLPAMDAKYGYLCVRDGKSRNAKRNLSLTARVSAMLSHRQAATCSDYVFPGETAGAPFLGTSLNHQHQKVRAALKLPSDFVIHSLRHTMLTRLGEAGVEAFTIMKIAGHSSITVSQRYVHPSPESVERAFERLEAFNGKMGTRSSGESVLHGPATVSATLPTGSFATH